MLHSNTFRDQWAIPRGAGFIQCFFCGHLSTKHTEHPTERGRLVPTCGNRHLEDGRRILPNFRDQSDD